MNLSYQETGIMTIVAIMLVISIITPSRSEVLQRDTMVNIESLLSTCMTKLEATQ